jgi:hypothetical protein
VEPSPEPSPASDATAVSGGVIAIAVLGVLAVVAVVAIIVVRRRSSEQ